VHLDHAFTVPTGIEEAWAVLLDAERVAPCMPGATLESVEGDEFHGSVKVKLGPINLTYKGKAAFIDKDDAAHRVVIDARGKDARGAGTAAAVVTATLVADGDASTKVDVHTELDITGKPAQFGRGVMVDVGNKIIGQFADHLADMLTSPEAAAPLDMPAAEEDAAGVSTSVTVPAPTAQPQRRAAEHIDLMEHAGPAMAKRLAPLVVVALVVLLVVRRRRRS
jgi:carbon monoxide dehydrogenase subunit G